MHKDKVTISNEELCIQIQNGDTDAMNQLIKQNEGFIRKTGYEIFNRKTATNISLCIDIKDLLQEGRIALASSVYSFDVNFNFKFLTYAHKAIENAMLDYIRKFYTYYDGKNIAGKYRLTEFKNIEGKLSREYIIDQRIRDPKNICIKIMQYDALYDAIRKASDRDKAYILYRYGFLDNIDHSLIDTANHFNMSLSRTKHTESIAIKNVREQMDW